MGFREADKPWCIFLVDDEPSVCKALSQTLTEHSYRVRSFTRASECLAAMREEPCDLLITDLSLPEMDGMELLKAAKAINSHLPVLMITGYGEVSTAVKAIKAGACDFIQKPLDEETFLPVVTAALEQNAVAEGGDLTQAERRVLRLIVDGKGNKEIAYQLGCSTRTVENHRYRLMHKLKVSSTAALVKVALTQGLAGMIAGLFILDFRFWILD